MKKTLQQTVFLAILMCSFFLSAQTNEFAPAGLQPQVCLDNNRVARIVFGLVDSIFCCTSTDEGVTFSKPAFVGHITGMHLGMTRGPLIASSGKFSIITAIDKKGNIHYYRLNHSGSNWEYKGIVNDKPFSAPEGLMGLAADKKDHFYAVWLDLRQGKMNNICFSALTADAGKWSKNEMIYISPDQHVCECCKPNIDVNGSKIAVMFRNWLNGSRDLYVMTSENMGKTFTKAEKLGFGTWKLNACPMDGGGIGIDPGGKIHTAWRREGLVYYCNPLQPEVFLSKGRDCSIAVNKSDPQRTIVTMQDEGNVKIMDLITKKEIVVGKGIYLNAILISGKEVLCTWEQDKKVKFRKINL